MVWISKYELQSRSRLNALDKGVTTHGLLLCLKDSESNKMGYADICPHSFWGDPNLEAILRDNETPLFKNALAFAHRELEAKNNGRSLFSQSSIQSNYLLLADEMLSCETYQKKRDLGFEKLKIKGMPNVLELAKSLNAITLAPRSLRIDFNASLNLQQFQLFFSSLSSRSCEAIEYIEDPFAWSVEEWQKAQNLLPLAADEFAEKAWGIDEAARYLVLKPARLGVEKIKQGMHRLRQQECIFTSAMDHWVGILHTISVAQEIKGLYPSKVHPIGGFLTMQSYRNFPTYPEIQCEGATIFLPSGPGLGLDLEMRNYEWVLI